MNRIRLLVAVWFGCLTFGDACGQIAVSGKVVYTMSGPPIHDGMVVIQNGKISAIGRADQIKVPEGFKVLEAAVVTPGLIDAHTTVGLSGILNVPHDQDQLEGSEPIQPELRAIDAYNPSDPLVDWIRSFGVTTIHVCHAPGELISGQTLIAKTRGRTVAEAVIEPSKAVAATLGIAAHKSDGKSPGTRGKSIAMLRAELISAREYLEKHRLAAAAGSESGTGLESSKGGNVDDKGNGLSDGNKVEVTRPADPPARNLRLETLGQVLSGDKPLMITSDRARDIASALRLAGEFQITIWLDGACESYLLLDEIKTAGVPVISHPPMQRAFGERENLSFETPARLIEAGIPIALQSGFESYVPKTRVVLFEAAIAAANGLSFEQSLATITIDAARILGIDHRVGSLEPGKDGDLALYDGDPFEYTTHCVACVIDGEVFSDTPR